MPPSTLTARADLCTPSACMTLLALSLTRSGYVMPWAPLSRMRHCGAGCAMEVSPRILCALPRSSPQRSRLCFTPCRCCCDSCGPRLKFYRGYGTRGTRRGRYHQTHQSYCQRTSLLGAAKGSQDCGPHDRRVFATVHRRGDGLLTHRPGRLNTARCADRIPNGLNHGPFGQKNFIIPNGHQRPGKVVK